MIRDTLLPLAILIIGLLVIISCRSDEKAILDWYQKNYDQVKRDLPPTEECDRYASAYVAMNNDVEIASKRFEQDIVQSATLWRQGRINEVQRDQMQKVRSQDHMRWIEGRLNAFERETHWDTNQRTYCQSRLNAAYDAYVCAGRGESMIRRMDSDEDWRLSDFAVVEYCLEHSPGFLAGY